MCSSDSAAEETGDQRGGRQLREEGERHQQQRKNEQGGVEGKGGLCQPDGANSRQDLRGRVSGKINNQNTFNLLLRAGAKAASALHVWLRIFCNPPFRYKSNEDYVYVRGRGRGKYICEECGIRCKKPSMLKKHIRTHTDVRPYICRVCNFAFKTKGEVVKTLSAIDK